MGSVLAWYVCRCEPRDSGSNLSWKSNSFVALPAEHPLSTLDRVPLGKIKDLPVVFFSRQLMPSLHAQVVELYRRVDAFPKVAQYAVHLQTIIGLVASGVGPAILPESARLVTREGVVYRPLEAANVASWVGLAWVEGDNSSLVENFARTIREVAEGKAFRSPLPWP